MTEARRPSFRELEHAGWNAKAGVYGEYAGQITSQATTPLLDAARVAPAQLVLDVATGPGYVAGGATARGAIATGVDFAPAMIAQARQNFPGTIFLEGDAESLAFASEFFDAVLCPFGLLHLADPDKAIAEAYRVLKPGGCYAFSVWSPPERHQFFRIVLSAIAAHGSMNVALPEAPPFFRFGDFDECRRTLLARGFRDIEIKEASLSWQPQSASEILDMIYKSSVRTALLLEAQTPSSLAAIHEAIIGSAQQLSNGDHFDIPWSAVIVAASRPAP